MKNENLAFLVFGLFVAVAAGGYITYEQSARKSAPVSQVSFPSSQAQQNQESQSPGEREEQYPEGHQTEEERNAAEINQLPEAHPSLLEDNNLTSNEGSGLAMDPANIIVNPFPVPPLEEGDSEAAEANHNLRIRNIGLESRVASQVRDIETLRTRVSEMNETIARLEGELEEQQRVNSRMQRTSDSSPTQQNQQPRQRTTEHSSGIDLVRISGDQAWIRTPDGRTYIVEQGDSVGSELVIGIERDRVVTSSGVISQ